MPPPAPTEATRKHFTVEEANRALPLVRAIVTDVVRQLQSVHELRQRLPSVVGGRRRGDDVYSEEMAKSQAEMEAEEGKLTGFVDELTKLGVEFKGPDGTCDFPSIMDGREVFLCWKLGEPEVAHWHETQGGFAGRRPLAPSPSRRSS